MECICALMLASCSVNSASYGHMFFLLANTALLAHSRSLDGLKRLLRLPYYVIFLRRFWGCNRQCPI